MLEQKIDVVISTNVNFYKETEIGINFKIVEIVRRREGMRIWTILFGRLKDRSLEKFYQERGLN